MNRLKQKFIIGAVALPILLSSCLNSRSYGPVEEESRNVKNFDELEVSHGIDVYVTFGDDTDLRVETHEDLMNDLVTEVRGKTLKIYFEGSFIWAQTANVYVQAQEIVGISASGGSNVDVEETIMGRDLALSASGGSDIEAEVDVENLEVEVSGGADIEIAGKADYLQAITSGGSDLDAYDLVVRRARLEASGGSDMNVYVEEELDARASGGADIHYRGDPDFVDAHDSSGGDVSSSD